MFFYDIPSDKREDTYSSDPASGSNAAITFRLRVAKGAYATWICTTEARPVPSPCRPALSQSAQPHTLKACAAETPVCCPPRLTVGSQTHTVGFTSWAELEGACSRCEAMCPTGSCVCILFASGGKSGQEDTGHFLILCAQSPPGTTAPSSQCEMVELRVDEAGAGETATAKAKAAADAKAAPEANAAVEREAAAPEAAAAAATAAEDAKAKAMKEAVAEEGDAQAVDDGEALVQLVAWALWQLEQGKDAAARNEITLGDVRRVVVAKCASSSLTPPSKERVKQAVIEVSTNRATHHMDSSLPPPLHAFLACGNKRSLRSAPQGSNKRSLRSAPQGKGKGASAEDAINLDDPLIPKMAEKVEKKKGSVVPTPASEFGRAFPKSVCTLLGITDSACFGKFRLVPLPTKLSTGEDSFRFTLDLAQQFHSAASANSLVLLPDTAVSVQSVCNPMLSHTSLSHRHPCLAPSLSRDLEIFPPSASSVLKHPPASLVQPFSLTRGTYYSVFPRQVEALIEGFLAAAFRQKNVIWMAFSPPGTGFCGQLVANILFQANSWSQSAYAERHLPAAVANGIATPILPRISKIDSQNRCFETISCPVPSPKWRPQRPVDGDNEASWNGYTISQYSASHDVTALIEAFVGARKSLMAFMKEKVRPHAHMCHYDTQTWLRIITAAKLWGAHHHRISREESGAECSRLTFTAMIGLIKPLFHSEELGNSHMVDEVVDRLCQSAMNIFDRAIDALKCLPPLYVAAPSCRGAELGASFFVKYATPTSHPHFHPDGNPHA